MITLKVVCAISQSVFVREVIELGEGQGSLVFVCVFVKEVLQEEE